MYAGCLLICYSQAECTGVKRSQFWGKIQRTKGWKDCLGSGRNWVANLTRLFFQQYLLKIKLASNYGTSGPLVYSITQYGTSTKLIQIYTEVSISMNRFYIYILYNSIYKSVFLLPNIYLFLYSSISTKWNDHWKERELYDMGICY